MSYQVVEITTIDTEGKGSLSFFESNKDIPFDIKRVYYIYGVGEGVQRGGHAHKQLKQLLFCPYGAIDLLLDDGTRKVVISLDDASKGVIVSGLVWREMIWREQNSVLAVAASEYYSEEDYIRDYETFQKELFA